MAYKITFKHSVWKDLEELHKRDAARVLDKLEEELTGHAEQYPLLPGKAAYSPQHRSYSIVYSLENGIYRHQDSCQAMHTPVRASQGRAFISCFFSHGHSGPKDACSVVKNFTHVFSRRAREATQSKTIAEGLSC